MTMPKNLVLVRHGESEGNVATRMVQNGDSSLMECLDECHTEEWRLSPTGREQAIKTRRWLQEEFVDGYFTRCSVSSYARAVETAGLLQIPDAQWLMNPMLVERSWGHVSSLTANKRREGLAAEDLGRKERDGIWWSPAGGESIAGMFARLHAVLDSLHREQSDGNVIIVCHGEVMWAMRVLLERISTQRFRELDESRNPFDRIHNCQILHYSRVDPKTAKEHPRFGWKRSICPWDDSLSTNDWTRIVRKKFSNDELLRYVEGYTQHLDE